MVIHFTSSRSNVVNDFETLRKIIEVIHKTGNVLARDWMEPQYHIEVTKTIKEPDPRAVYELNMDAIERSEMVIIEASYKSFGAGFQVAAAIYKKKPILLLIKRGVKNESTFSRGLQTPLVTRVEYDENNLERVVQDFIEANAVSTKDLRFNFVIDRKIYNHLRWKSYKSRKTKGELVRELLLKDMEMDD